MLRQPIPGIAPTQGATSLAALASRFAGFGKTARISIGDFGRADKVGKKYRLL
jgi:hypothetical protein